MATSQDAVANALFDVIDAAVREILRHENPERFLDWMRANARRLLPAEVTTTEDGGAALSVALGRAIWNATPLPGNHFRPKPVSEPGRNDPCPCGSGRKYKQCCAHAPRFDMLTAEEVWPILIAQLPRARLDEAVSARRIPPAALAAAAVSYLDDGLPNKAAALLEPVFENDVERLDERFETAFDLLCDAYAEQGNERKRQRFAERIAQQAHGALQRAAWQRLAAMRHDAGQFEAAWEAIRMANQAEPGHPIVGLNELTLLVSENRLDEARARATFWVAKLTREQYPDDAVLEMFRAAVRDPARALAQAMVAHTGADLDRLATWVTRMEQQPLPRYRLQKEQVLDPSDMDSVREAMRQRMLAMGVAHEHLEAESERLAREIQKTHERAQRKAARRGTPPPQNGDLFDDEDATDAIDTDSGRPEFELHPAESLAALEQAWHQVFPCTKPMLTAPVSGDIEEAWTPQAQADWIAFLERRPEAADSLDILDDVAGALLHLEWELPQGARGGLAARVIERGCAIVEGAVADHPDATLPWATTRNRNAIRALARRGALAIEARDDAAICGTAGAVLALNPHDNHGLRLILVNSYLRRGMDAQAAELVERYCEDGSPEMQGATVLLAFRRGDIPAATSLLQPFIESNPYVLDYLLRPNAPAPRASAGPGLLVGGREEAWEYCASARDLWAGTPGAMEWLQRVRRSIRQQEAERKGRTKAASPQRKARSS